MKENNKIWLRYIICFGLIAILCYLFPYTGDDWAWGSKIGIDRLNNWFENYNGRYVGNLIVLAMTRSNLLKAVIMSFCLTGIVAITKDRIHGGSGKYNIAGTFRCSAHL